MSSINMSERILDSDQLQDLLTNYSELPTIPEILFQILRILDDPDSGASDLADVIRLDAPLSARILRLANSPYYSVRGGMGDIHRCIAVLGYRTIRQVAICVSVATSVVAAAARANGQMDYRDLWRHSVAAGAIAKHLAEITGHPEPEEVFTAGLLHDLGKFVLEIYSPTTYGQVVRSRKDKGQTLEEAEREVFGFDHAVLGEAFGFSWRFPGMLNRCFGHHHETLEPLQEIGDENHALGLVALADQLSHSLVPSASDLGYDPDHLDLEALHAAAGLSTADIAEAHDQLLIAVQESSIYLDLG